MKSSDRVPGTLKDLTLQQLAEKHGRTQFGDGITSAMILREVLKRKGWDCSSSIGEILWTSAYILLHELIKHGNDQ